jgi:iron complex transport system ATP-binding protein
MTPAIACRGVTVRVGTKTLLDDVSLAVAPGEVVVLVGPNGAGKSTLMRTLAGELKPASGGVTLKGRAIRSYTSRELSMHRAVLSQNTSVAFPFTVGEVVRMGAGDRHGRAIEDLAERALDDVDLAAFSDRIIGTLSGGEQQRAHFARVLVQLACGEAVHGHGLLLLDEPTASLDLKHRLDVLQAVGRCARRGVAVVAILHDLNLAAMSADRIAVLDQGCVAAVGTPAETVTDELLARVFNCSLTVSRAPPPGVPFVLPHAITTIRATAGMR